MAYPTIDRVDVATYGFMLGLLGFVYFVYPRHFLQVAAWYTNIMIFTCWTGYFFYRLAFGESPL